MLPAMNELLRIRASCSVASATDIVSLVQAWVRGQTPTFRNSAWDAGASRGLQGLSPNGFFYALTDDSAHPPASDTKQWRQYTARIFHLGVTTVIPGPLAAE